MTSFNWRNIFMIAVVFVQSFAVSANNELTTDNKITITKTDDAKVALTLVQLNEERATIRLTDNAGQLLFSKNINNKSDYGLSLDLSKLENGSYTLEVERNDRSYSNSVTVKDGDIQLSTLNIVFKPVITTTQSGFSVTNPNAQVKKVVILDNKSEVVYTKDYTNDEQFRKNHNASYNVKTLVSGSYTVQVETANGSYFKIIDLK